MCLLHAIDNCAQLYDDMQLDPYFYSAKAYMREIYPEALLIEIIPGAFQLADVTVVLISGETFKTLI